MTDRTATLTFSDGTAPVTFPVARRAPSGPT